MGAREALALMGNRTPRSTKRSVRRRRLRLFLREVKRQIQQRVYEELCKMKTLPYTEAGVEIVTRTVREGLRAAGIEPPTPRWLMFRSDVERRYKP